MRRASTADLLLVTKAVKERLSFLAAGASLRSRTGYEIAELQKKAATDRIALSQQFLTDARRLKKSGIPTNRTIVSRCYYAMYHAMRSATYIDHGGDDHEQHTTLPSKLPKDFPDRNRWSNILKNARFERNRADYDPYPRRDADFKEAADKLLEEASELVKQARMYVATKP
ncbi:HEPN domain-containing protein [Stenotrophomonas maltophilia]|uniref:HEPN domain-containing protein n=1 Tax=Stenotrophomonas maltophilia TaxID=40324 RepID=UPI001C97891A